MSKSVRELMREAREAEKKGPVEINRLRNLRLAELVAFARVNSPYYQKLYKGLPDGPTLAQLPITSKKELMPHFEDWVTDREVTYEKVHKFISDPSQIGRTFMGKYTVALTSGTTGTPGYFLHDKFHKTVLNACLLSSVSTVVSLGDILRIILRGIRMASVTAVGAHFVVAAGTTAMSRLPLIGRAFRQIPAQWPMPEIVAGLNEFRPAILGGYASMMMLLANEQEAGRLRVNPVIVMPSSEATPLGGAARLARLFKAKVLLSYAATELLFLAWGCKEEWQHIISDWLTFEPVDRDYRAVPPGVQSHTVLISNLANRVQPIIRYDLGDSILVRPDPCPCGNPHMAVRVQGRSGDLVMFEAVDGKPVAVAPLQLATAIDRTPGVAIFQIVQTAPNTLRVRLRCKPTADPRSVWKAVDAALTELLRTQNASHVTIERAEEPPDDPPGRKYRTVIPLGK